MSAGAAADAAGQEGTWHHRLVELADGWPPIRTLNDQLTALLGPWREKYQGNPVLELMHGGRWLGHPLHPALSDLPIGLWAGALILDLAGGDPARGAFCGGGIVGGECLSAPGATPPTKPASFSTVRLTSNTGRFLTRWSSRQACSSGPARCR